MRVHEIVVFARRYSRDLCCGDRVPPAGTSPIYESYIHIDPQLYDRLDLRPDKRAVGGIPIRGVHVRDGEDVKGPHL